MNHTMSLTLQKEDNGVKLLNFFRPTKTKTPSTSSSWTGYDLTNVKNNIDPAPSATKSQSMIHHQFSSSTNHNDSKNAIEGPPSDNMNPDTNWTTSAIISRFNAQKQKPIKRYNPMHDDNVFAHSPPLAPGTSVSRPVSNSPRKRYPPPQPYFKPSKTLRLYRNNFPSPSYTTPNTPSIDKDHHAMPVEKRRLVKHTPHLISAPSSPSATPIPSSTLSSRKFESASLNKKNGVSVPSPRSLPSHTLDSANNNHSSDKVSTSDNTKSFHNKSNDECRTHLSDEQQRVLDIVVKDRQSIFLTGSAGTGKSVLMREIVSALRNKYGNAVAVTASTGIAACNIAGTTLHRFAGIGLGDESSIELIRKIEKNSAAKERWKKTSILIIDEISMVDANLFDKLVDIGRHFRGINKGFGGMQVIVTGDFFQLPPVKTSEFAFEASSWTSVITKTVVLTHVFRQKDPEFVQVLNEMRVGVLSQKAIKLLKSLERPLPESNVDPTKLYPLKHQVEQSNHMRLQALVGTMHEFEATDSGPDQKKLESCIAPALIRLKKDAQVMLLKNVDESLVNGSLGIVIGFAGEDDFGTTDSIVPCLFPRRREITSDADLQIILARHYPVVRFANGRVHVIENELWSSHLADGTEIATREQIPLVLAWALSIHKSQGQTLDRVTVDLEQSFEDGMAYVALSRAVSLQSIQVTNFNPLKVKTSRKVIEYYKNLQGVD